MEHGKDRQVQLFRVSFADEAYLSMESYAQCEP
jgi:hypothetical protein